MPNSMEKSFAPVRNPDAQALRDAPISETLEFPVAPDFLSRPPRVELAAMLQRIEETMPWRSTRPGVKERRLAEKVPVEFVL
jgi:hypothetical protein